MGEEGQGSSFSPKVGELTTTAPACSLLSVFPAFSVGCHCSLKMGKLCLCLDCITFSLNKPTKRLSEVNI